MNSSSLKMVGWRGRGAAPTSMLQFRFSVVNGMGHPLYILKNYLQKLMLLDYSGRSDR